MALKDKQTLLDSFHAALADADVRDRSDLAQDIIDVAAAAAGLKPAAVVGLGCPLSDSARQIGAAARSSGMAVAECRPWRATCDIENLPAWYAEALAALYAGVRILVFAPQPHALRSLAVPSGPLTPLREATALGYPRCCVVDHHRRRNAYHVLNLHMLSRQTEGDEREMSRLLRAGVSMTPRDDMEVAALMAATRTVFAPGTSVAMCDACAADADSPARRMSEQFRSFAEKADFIRYLPAQS